MRLATRARQMHDTRRWKLRDDTETRWEKAARKALDHCRGNIDSHKQHKKHETTKSETYVLEVARQPGATGNARSSDPDKEVGVSRPRNDGHAMSIANRDLTHAAHVSLPMSEGTLVELPCQSAQPLSGASTLSDINSLHEDDMECVEHGTSVLELSPQLDDADVQNSHAEEAVGINRLRNDGHAVSNAEIDLKHAAHVSLPTSEGTLGGLHPISDASTLPDINSFPEDGIGCAENVTSVFELSPQLDDADVQNSHADEAVGIDRLRNDGHAVSNAEIDLKHAAHVSLPTSEGTLGGLHPISDASTLPDINSFPEDGIGCAENVTSVFELSPPLDDADVQNSHADEAVGISRPRNDGLTVSNAEIDLKHAVHVSLPISEGTLGGLHPISDASTLPDINSFPDDGKPCVGLDAGPVVPLPEVLNQNSARSPAAPSEAEEVRTGGEWDEQPNITTISTIPTRSTEKKGTQRGHARLLFRRQRQTTAVNTLQKWFRSRKTLRVVATFFDLQQMERERQLARQKILQRKHERLHCASTKPNAARSAPTIPKCIPDGVLLNRGDMCVDAASCTLASSPRLRSESELSCGTEDDLATLPSPLGAFGSLPLVSVENCQDPASIHGKLQLHAVPDMTDTLSPDPLFLAGSGRSSPGADSWASVEEPEPPNDGYIDESRSDHREEGAFLVKVSPSVNNARTDPVPVSMQEQGTSSGSFSSPAQESVVSTVSTHQPLTCKEAEHLAESSDVPVPKVESGQNADDTSDLGSDINHELELRVVLGQPREKFSNLSSDALMAEPAVNSHESERIHEFIVGESPEQAAGQSEEEKQEKQAICPPIQAPGAQLAVSAHGLCENDANVEITVEADVPVAGQDAEAASGVALNLNCENDVNHTSSELFVNRSTRAPPIAAGGGATVHDTDMEMETTLQELTKIAAAALEHAEIAVARLAVSSPAAFLHPRSEFSMPVSRHDNVCSSSSSSSDDGVMGWGSDGSQASETKHSKEKNDIAEYGPPTFFPPGKLAPVVVAEAGTDWLCEVNELQAQVKSLYVDDRAALAEKLEDIDARKNALGAYRLVFETSDEAMYVHVAHAFVLRRMYSPRIRSARWGIFRINDAKRRELASRGVMRSESDSETDNDEHAAKTCTKMLASGAKVDVNTHKSATLLSPTEEIMVALRSAEFSLRAGGERLLFPLSPPQSTDIADGVSDSRCGLAPYDVEWEHCGINGEWVPCVKKFPNGGTDDDVRNAVVKGFRITARARDVPFERVQLEKSTQQALRRVDDCYAAIQSQAKQSHKKGFHIWLRPGTFELKSLERHPSPRSPRDPSVVLAGIGGGQDDDNDDILSFDSDSEDDAGVDRFALAEAEFQEQWEWLKISRDFDAILATMARCVARPRVQVLCCSALVKVCAVVRRECGCASLTERCNPFGTAIS